MTHCMFLSTFYFILLYNFNILTSFILQWFFGKKTTTFSIERWRDGRKRNKMGGAATLAIQTSKRKVMPREQG